MLHQSNLQYTHNNTGLLSPIPQPDVLYFANPFKVGSSPLGPECSAPNYRAAVITKPGWRERKENRNPAIVNIQYVAAFWWYRTVFCFFSVFRAEVQIILSKWTMATRLPSASLSNYMQLNIRCATPACRDIDFTLCSHKCFKWSTNNKNINIIYSNLKIHKKYTK